MANYWAFPDCTSSIVLAQVLVLRKHGSVDLWLLRVPTPAIKHIKTSNRVLEKIICMFVCSWLAHLLELVLNHSIISKKSSSLLLTCCLGIKSHLSVSQYAVSGHMLSSFIWRKPCRSSPSYTSQKEVLITFLQNVQDSSFHTLGHKKKTGKSFQ